MSVYPSGHFAQATESAGDREWFMAHPHARYRIRAKVAGEDAGREPECDIVLVEQIAPGYRVRRFIGKPAANEGDNIHAIIRPDGEVVDIVQPADGTPKPSVVNLVTYRRREPDGAA